MVFQTKEVSQTKRKSFRRFF